MASPTQSPQEAKRTQRSRALTQARIDAFAKLARYFCITDDLLAPLLNISIRHARRLLHQLEHEEHVAASIGYFNRHFGASEFAYVLNSAGVRRALRLGIATDTTKPGHELSPDSIPHILGITRFHIRLDTYCEERGWKLTWRQTKLKKLRKVKEYGRRAIKGIHPDGLLRIETPEHTSFIGTYDCERQKLGHEDDQGDYDITRKCRRHDAYWDSDMCDEDFGERKLPMIIEMRTDQRAKNLAAHLRAKGMERGIFLICSTETPFTFITPKTDYSPTFDSLLKA